MIYTVYFTGSSSLLSKAENSFNNIDEEILKKILKKLVDVKIKHGPWKWVKNKIRFGD